MRIPIRIGTVKLFPARFSSTAINSQLGIIASPSKKDVFVAVMEFRGRQDATPTSPTYVTYIYRRSDLSSGAKFIETLVTSYVNAC